MYRPSLNCIATPLESSGTFLKVPGQQASGGQLCLLNNVQSQFPTKVPLINEIDNVVPGQLQLFSECVQHSILLGLFCKKTSQKMYHQKKNRKTHLKKTDKTPEKTHK